MVCGSKGAEGYFGRPGYILKLITFLRVLLKMADIDMDPFGDHNKTD